MSGAAARRPARCPRCGEPFHCGVDGAAPCACTVPKLSATQQQSLRERYRGCLCLRCLHALASGEALHPPRTGGG
jgi:hypothetical protein